MVHPPRSFIFFRECENVVAVVSVKEGSVSMTEPGFRGVLIECRRMWMIWRKRQIHESAKGTDHECDRKLRPFAFICPFHKRLNIICDSPQLLVKVSIIESGAPPCGQSKGLLRMFRTRTRLVEGEEMGSGLPVGRFFWAVFILATCK